MREPQRSWQAEALAAVQAELAPPRAPELDAFVGALMRDVDRRLWRTRGGRGLAALVWRMYEFARERKSGLQLRVWNPPDTPGRTAIEAVQPDRPFLVDTTRLLLRELELREECFVHPVLQVDRSDGGFALGRGERESVMYVEVAPRVADPDAIEAELRRRFATLAAITDDHRRMVRAVRDVEANVELAAQFIPGSGRADKIRRFLGWLAGENFVFMGTRSYQVGVNAAGETRVSLVPGSGLGIFREDATSRFAAPLEGAEIPEELREQLADSRIILIGKSRIPSTVHRAGRLDRLLVKEHDERGRLCGFSVVCGLFTFRALRTPGSQIPLLYERLEAILLERQAAPNSHRQKAIVTAFDQTPAEFLLASHPDAAGRVIEELIAAEGSDETRLVLSVDPNRRSLYAAVAMPRYRYHDDQRWQIEAVLAQHFGPLHADSRTSFIEEDTAVIHLFCTPVGPRLREVAPEQLERAVRERIAGWAERLADALAAHLGHENGLELAAFYEDAFSAPYRADTHPQDAARDVAALEALHAALGVPQFALYRELDAPHDTLLKVFLSEPRLLSELLPIVDRFGIQVVDARREEVRAANRQPATLVALRVVPLGEQIDLDALLPRLGDALRAVLLGTVEGDALSALVLLVGLDWREIDLLRTYVAYFQQIQGALTAAHVQQTLLGNPLAVRALLALHRARLDPSLAESERAAREAALRAEFEQYRSRIPSLNEDRALSGLFALVEATVRSSFFAERASYRLSLKLDATRIAELEPPRPHREIVVSAPGLFGVHIRGGPIARGGIRYSDRPGDLRTEILGLMRTQMLKNGIIVPVGAKGGFVVSPPPTTPAEARSRGDAKYREFIAGLLDVTDNLDANGAVVPPAGVHRRDGDDPYLVVAADKGTAHLSDTANAVAAERGFWLGDAFASGGSAGYDHKKFAITARGAWECARHHFAELGIDPERDSYSAVGIGDMSGDVFGNGLLLLRRVRLLAAFDHRHVFLDPDPDPEAAWHERKRLFEKPGSSWSDYDASRISRGGGVFRRDASRIALSPAARAMLGLESTSASGEEVVRAVLRMPVDLLWNGGIGTYVKSVEESQAEVRDRANDAVRVDGRELRARVVAEGGNLGFTQLGRCEAARAGVRLETDSIDNSGGVDLSDHEVNSKIALAPLVALGELSLAERDALLAELAEETCERVLAHNRAQALGLSLDERRARLDREGFLWAIEFLCRAEGMSPAQGKLPDSAELEARGGSLLRPELAWLLGLAKLQLQRALLADERWRLPEFAMRRYRAYFPERLAAAHPRALAEHRLAREIGAMVATNHLIDAGGVALIPLLCRELEAPAPVVANALLLAHEVLADLDYRERVLALPGAQREAVYDALLLHDRAVRGVARLLVRRRRLDVAPETVARWRGALRELRALRADLPAQSAPTRGEDEISRFAARGLPPDLARDVANAAVADLGASILWVSEDAGAPLAATAIAYTTLGERTFLNWGYDRIARTWPTDSWDRVELELLRGELLDLHARLTTAVLAGGAADPVAAVELYLTPRAELLARIEELQRRAAMSDRPSALAAVTKALQRLVD